jgi:glutamate transport system permease protein
MNVLLDHLALFRQGFLGTVSLTALSGIIALALGVVIAAFRVSPVPALRAFGAAWVLLFRNTPLTLLFWFAVLCLPQLGLNSLSFFQLAIVALSTYTSAFVCEAVRSGINTVPLGQAEAARSIGMTFSQTLSAVVLPQATRTALPTISSLMIALTRNSAIAGGFSVFDLFGVQATLRELGENTFVTFFWIAAAYLVLALLISSLFRFLENRLAVAR